MMRGRLDQARRPGCKQLTHSRSREGHTVLRRLLFDGCGGAGFQRDRDRARGASLATTRRPFSCYWRWVRRRGKR